MRLSAAWRAFVAAAFFGLAQASTAAPFTGIFYGEIETYEVYTGGQWVDAMGTLTSTSMTLSLQANHTYPCAHSPSTTYCYGQPLGDSIGHFLYLALTAGGLHIAPDVALPCWPVVGICEPFDPVTIVRDTDGDYAYIGDHMAETNQAPDRPGTYMHAVHLYLEGDWIPPGVVDLTSLRGINGSIFGYGDFQQIRSLDPEGDIRGTFSIHTGYVPTPGTFALVGLGVLAAALRRRH